MPRQLALAPNPVPAQSSQSPRPERIHASSQSKHNRRPTSLDWEDLRETIRKLIIKEDKTANAVLDILRRDYGFQTRYRRIPFWAVFPLPKQ